MHRDAKSREERDPHMGQTNAHVRTMLQGVPINAMKLANYNADHYKSIYIDKLSGFTAIQQQTRNRFQ
jgi:hypothetical protein